MIEDARKVMRGVSADHASSLRDDIEALGGELELAARFPDGEVIKVG